MPNGHKLNEMCFIMEGPFGLYSTVQRDPTRLQPPFVVLQRHTVYGDYQILLDLKPNMVLRTLVHDNRLEHIMSQIPKEDLTCEEYVVMCLDAEKLQDLAELYPATADSLKYRGLERR